MSTNYGFRCNTCGLHMIGTRDREACIDVLLLAPHLKTLFASKHSRVLDIRFNRSVYWDSWNPETDMDEEPFDFVAEHATHNLVVISEYGEQQIGENNAL